MFRNRRAAKKINGSQRDLIGRKIMKGKGMRSKQTHPPNKGHD